MHDLLSIYPPTMWIVLVMAGVAIGLLAGLLGVGGGIVAVPVLLEIFAAIDIAEPAAVALAVGTAQATILLTSLAAALAHWRAGTMDRPLIRSWLPAMVFGAAVGLAAGPFAPAKLLTAVFAAVAILLAAKMVLGEHMFTTRRPLKGVGTHVVATLVGVLASALGVGGGTLSTPVLSMFSFPIRRAIGAGALFNLVIALPATLTFLSTGWSVPGRPADSVGNVAVFCVAALSLPALFVAPVAARWSAHAPVVVLRRLFALCLAAIAVRILMRL
ncbi:MAG: sulfite exporter TauE/SafE family protein [Reyranellales bacterium]